MTSNSVTASATARVDRLLQINFGRLDLALPDNRRVDAFGFPIRPAPDNRVIFLGYPTRVHAKPEFTRRCRRFCNQDNAAGFPIEPIHNGNSVHRLAISKASNWRNSAQSVVVPSGLEGCTSKNGGLSTTI